MASLENKIAPAPPTEKSFWERAKDYFWGKKTVAQDTQNQLASLDTAIHLPTKKIEAGEKKIRPLFPDARLHQWDNNLKFFEKDLKPKKEILSRKITIVRDAGLTFYSVQRGDTISGIRKKLVKLDEFSYLEKPEYASKEARIFHFNIRPGNLKAGMLIPIPVEAEERYLKDEQFANYCQAAIWEMKTDKNYGKKIESLLKKFSEKDLVELMIAVAKQESGGKPLGQCTFHRWENHLRAFSFSIFHIVMRGPGIRARTNLGFTEGQTYHPKNAAKLFLAFLIEKANERGEQVENYLPAGKEKTSRRFSQFASFYNGSGWKHYNPKYVKNLKKYLDEAHKTLNGEGDKQINKPNNEEVIRLAMKKKKIVAEKIAKPKQPEVSKIAIVKPEVETFEVGENANLKQAILDANWLTFENSGTNHLQNNRNVKLLTDRVLQFIAKRYPATETTYFTTDRIGVGSDEHGIFLIFERESNRDILRIPKEIEKEQRLKFLKIGKNSIFQSVLNSNFENGRPIASNHEALSLSFKLEIYLQKIYRSKIYFPTDEIIVLGDQYGPYLIFRRAGKNSGPIRP